MTEDVDGDVGKDRIALCESAEGDARRAANALEETIRAEKDRASSEINKRFAGQRAALSAAVSDARAATIDAKNALPDHPWTGKRVYKERDVGSWGRKQIERLEGIVETRRSTTSFALNAKYGIPRIGEGFVRLNKKDGSTGAKFDSLSSGWNADEFWKLVEENQ